MAVRDLSIWIEQTTGETVDRSSTWRWCSYGLKASCGCQIRLPSVRLGKTRFTTEEAISWWTVALSKRQANSDAVQIAADEQFARRGL
ncbi:MAG: hypothetical protein ABL997_13510 [Planctomycetota bacterium]